jgi:alcohol-forming fatty acyl-CoA reductase
MREIFVANAYADQSVLVTGATGFLGKVLVEKLLRDCPQIKKIYILLRAKKGDSLEKRFENFKNLIIFKELKEKNPNALNKISAINGDFMEKNSGISESDFEHLSKNLNYIIHCAASVKFDEPLKVAIRMNTMSTKHMLHLAEKCNSLKAFVHVSTAFSNTNQEVIYEKIYEPICDYKNVISLVERDMDDEVAVINAMALKTFPNTYIFTKNLTETLVSDYSHLPVTIVRPSIVCPSFSEPYIGWVNCILVCNRRDDDNCLLLLFVLLCNVLRRS